MCNADISLPYCVPQFVTTMSLEAPPGSFEHALITIDNESQTTFSLAERSLTNAQCEKVLNALWSNIKIKAVDLQGVPYTTRCAAFHQAILTKEDETSKEML